MNDQVQIAFTTDKNRKPLAYRWSPLAARWIKIGIEDARLRISTSTAREVSYSHP
jgi:hypothetical protein